VIARMTVGLVLAMIFLVIATLLIYPGRRSTPGCSRSRTARSPRGWMRSCADTGQFAQGPVI
jgi:hypothetical protein